MCCHEKQFVEQGSGLKKGLDSQVAHGPSFLLLELCLIVQSLLSAWASGVKVIYYSLAQIQVTGAALSAAELVALRSLKRQLVERAQTLKTKLASSDSDTEDLCDSGQVT